MGHTFGTAIDIFSGPKSLQSSKLGSSDDGDLANVVVSGMVPADGKITNVTLLIREEKRKNGELLTSFVGNILREKNQYCCHRCVSQNEQFFSREILFNKYN